MNQPSVVFIAFEERENLGIRYLYAALSKAGHDSHIVDFQKDKQEILRDIEELNPLIVGFSVIFEKHLYEFKELIEFLRLKGIKSHFTSGGHFASLRPVALFEMIPDLDSIVRFEGEYTVVELADFLQQNKDWKYLPGISYMQNGKVVNNPLRALEPDLDKFPLPYRTELKKYAFDKMYSTLIAGRGCIYNCIFCDIREFYRHPPGPVKRVRNPELVVKEMKYLHKEYNCSIFLFQDDDFPIFTNNNTEWIKDFCIALKKNHLVGKIMWKINCRPDEVDPDLFELMRQHGLFKVYLGIEDGTDLGLAEMNKHIKASQILESIKLLKQMGISIDYGFMLFQPTTTFESLNENLCFLEEICSDGYMPVVFLKMMPYLETRIEKELGKEGRLKGTPGFLNYDFNSSALDEFFRFVYVCFNEWLYSAEGFCNIAKWGSNYLSVYRFYQGKDENIQQVQEKLQILISEANGFIIQTVKDLALIFQKNDTKSNPKLLKDYRILIKEKHITYAKLVKKTVQRIELYYLTRGLIML